MNVPEPFIRERLEQEQRSWSAMLPEQYDRVMCEMLEGLDVGMNTPERLEALLALADAILHRNAPRLIDSRACIFEQLLAVASDPATATSRRRIHALLLEAWRQLVAEAAAGPEHVSAVPDLPRGLVLPSGADPQAIDDPILRDAARELDIRYAQEVERWTASQRAIGHLYRLVALVHGFERAAGDSSEVDKQLERAMSAAPGLPSTLRKRLEGSA
ncbi:hypothetical protein [Paraburkholderia aromaticivorans]|uniref:hypothetical protein n=1 Tax=Paraburkholderia aromaticivorans TaxID=2026199 RepID=UPI0014560F59|nr:hypothetical protein [Paraburkholderia aromaticivorans]